MLPEEIEKNIKSITDSHKFTDQLMKGDIKMFFQCNGTGLYFPPDYVRMWGRKYGKGLGPNVVSECLETLWQSPLAVPKNLRHATQIMFPMGQGGHQLTAVMMKNGDADKIQMAIPAELDPFYDARAKIIRTIQIKNPNGRLKSYLSLKQIEG